MTMREVYARVLEGKLKRPDIIVGQRVRKSNDKCGACTNPISLTDLARDFCKLGSRAVCHVCASFITDKLTELPQPVKKVDKVRPIIVPGKGDLN